MLYTLAISLTRSQKRAIILLIDVVSIALAPIRSDQFFPQWGLLAWV